MTAIPLKSAELAITDPRLNRSLVRQDRRADLLSERLDEAMERLSAIETQLSRWKVPCPECHGTGGATVSSDLRRVEDCAFCRGEGAVSDLKASQYERMHR